MSMIIEEPKQKETFTQRKRREQREVSYPVLSPCTALCPMIPPLNNLLTCHFQSEARGKVPSKAERAAEEAARRDEALSKSTLDPNNKGFKMMAKLGFKAGQSLGKRENEETGDKSKDAKDREENKDKQSANTNRSEPLNLIFKEDRGGIGLDEVKKRKIREEAEEATKRLKQDEGDYRDRVREERELRKTEAQVRGAQKVAERLDTEAEETQQKDTARTKTATQTEHTDTQDHDKDGGVTGSPSPSASASANTNPIKSQKPTASINVLYRGLVREREDRERDIQARHALYSSLPSSFFPNQKLPSFDKSELERDDQTALGGLEPYTAAVEQELEEEDPELDAFNELPAAERLAKLVLYLRNTYRYCFWCKYRYENGAELDGCPGLTEEDHD